MTPEKRIRARKEATQIARLKAGRSMSRLKRTLTSWRRPIAGWDLRIYRGSPLPQKDDR